MRKLTFGMNLSLDGYIAAPGDDLGWSVPSDDLFQWWSDRVGATGLALYGRKLWETMSSHWPTADRRGLGPPKDLVAVRGSVCGTGAPGVPSDGEHGARPLAEILDGGPGWPLAGAEHRCVIRQRRLTKRSSWLRPVFRSIADTVGEFNRGTWTPLVGGAAQQQAHLSDHSLLGLDANSPTASIATQDP